MALESAIVRQSKRRKGHTSNATSDIAAKKLERDGSKVDLKHAFEKVSSKEIKDGHSANDFSSPSK